MLRKPLAAAWVMDSEPIINAAKAEGVCILAMFRAAEFELPKAYPARFQVWRAVRWGSLETAIGGYSWTPDRWYALATAGAYLAKQRGMKMGPFVVRRFIERHQVVFYARMLASEVVFDAPPEGERDGDEEAYWLEAERYANQRIKAAFGMK